MITDPVSTIKREVLQLIDLQIETLKQKSSLDSSQLNDYQARSERIRKLYEELDRIRPTQLLELKPGSLAEYDSTSNFGSPTILIKAEARVYSRANATKVWGGTRRTGHHLNAGF